MWHIFCIMTLVFYRLIRFVLADSILDMAMAWQIENNEGRAGGGGGGLPGAAAAAKFAGWLQNFMTSWGSYRANNCKLSHGTDPL
jgi:hypothetical protein